ncbi:MAG: RidA family protein [Candidatus Tectomicrobia bacterium]|nr:RidA family protein [Candidatus Tectomicrobia bacterium]
MARRLISSGSTFEKKVGYSRAVVQGDWCFVSGTTGYDYSTMQISEVLEDQIDNCFKTISGVLDEAGFSLSDVVRVLYIVPDRNMIAGVTATVGAYFGDIRPASTLIVAGLLEEEMKIEIEVTALRQS